MVCNFKARFRMNVFGIYITLLRNNRTFNEFVLGSEISLVNGRLSTALKNARRFMSHLMAVVLLFEVSAFRTCSSEKALLQTFGFPITDNRRVEGAF